MKIFVLLELTKDRESCNEVIRLLEESQQNEAALKLKTFNEALGVVKVSDECKLEVKRVSAPQLRVKSSVIGLSGNPRGKCLIVNLVEDQPTPNLRDRFGNHIHVQGLKNQTIQFSNVFAQMFFDVFVISEANVNELKQRLQALSKNKSLEESEAFVLIVISYGQNQTIVGSDGSLVLRDIRFGIRSGLETDSKEKLKTDVMPVKEIVALFADKSCPALKSKPKLFFFNCCQTPDYRGIYSYHLIPFNPRLIPFNLHLFLIYLPLNLHLIASKKTYLHTYRVNLCIYQRVSIRGQSGRGMSSRTSWATTSSYRTPVPEVCAATAEWLTSSDTS